MSAAPRLSIGLPVYNAEEKLTETLEALLGQSYGDFELIISDNASTDSTADICHRYGKQDSRIRYIRQPRNIGRVPNHNFLVGQARGELFKWVAGDDLYARDLLKRCVDVLDENPQVVLAHAWEGVIDESGAVISLVEYPVRSDPRGRRTGSGACCSTAGATTATASSGPRSCAGRPCTAATIWRTARSPPNSPCTGRSIRSRTGCISGATHP